MAEAAVESEAAAPQQPHRVAVSVSQAAQALGVTERAIWRRIRKNELPSVVVTDGGRRQRRVFLDTDTVLSATSVTARQSVTDALTPTDTASVAVMTQLAEVQTRLADTQAAVVDRLGDLTVAIRDLREALTPSVPRPLWLRSLTWGAAAVGIAALTCGAVVAAVCLVTVLLE